MATTRSRADKAQDGRKAYGYRIAQYGPDEQSRAARQAAWTRQHPGQDRVNNPHLREKVYSSADLDRAGQFAAWNADNPAQSHSVSIRDHVIERIWYLSRGRQPGQSLVARCVLQSGPSACASP